MGKTLHPALRLRLLLLLGLAAVIGLARPAVLVAQPASEPVFDLGFVEIYAELLPDRNEAEVIANTYFEGNGSDPVVFRLEGSFKRLQVTATPPDVWWVHRPPYILFPWLASGPRQLRFSYLVSRPGNEPSGAVIAPKQLWLGTPTFWYPRNTASDAHQVILDLVTPPDYPIVSNGRTIRDVPNNFKRLRTIILQNATAPGLILSGN